MNDRISSFEIEAERLNGACVVRVRGDLDLGTHEQLGERLVAEADGGPLIVDLSECDFIDSSGIRALLLGMRANSEGAGLTIAAPTSQVQRILEMTGLRGAIPVHASVEAALAEATG